MRTKMILVPVAMLALLFTEMTAHAGIVDGTALARPEKFFLIQVDADFHNSDKLLKLNLSVDARGPGLPVGSLEFFAVVHDARPGTSGARFVRVSSMTIVDADYKLGTEPVQLRLFFATDKKSRGHHINVQQSINERSLGGDTVLVLINRAPPLRPLGDPAPVSFSNIGFVNTRIFIPLFAPEADVFLEGSFVTEVAGP